jgi:hypothetical protein
VIRYWMFGPHGGTGNLLTGIGDIWRDLNSKGIPAFFKGVDDYGSCGELLGIGDEYGVKNTAAYRLSSARDGWNPDVPDWSAPSPEAAADFHVDQTLEYLPPEFDKRVWLEVINEPDKDEDGRYPGWGSAEFSEWLGRFMLRVLQRLLPLGFRVAGFGFSSGEPELDDWSQPAMIEFMRQAGTNPNVAIAVHEYSYQESELISTAPWLIGRFTKIFDEADRHGVPRPKILVSEFGWTLWHVPSPDLAVAQMVEVANLLYGPYPQILGVAIWFYGMGWNEIRKKAVQLLEPMHQVALGWRMDVNEPEPPEPPEPKHAAIIVKIPQEFSAGDRSRFVLEPLVAEFKRTVTASHDDAETMYLGGRPEDSEIQLVDPSLPSQVHAADYFAARGYRVTEHFFKTSPEVPIPLPPPPPSNRIDLLPFFTPGQTYGPLFELRRLDGSQERVQIQTYGQKFYVTKGTGGWNGKSEFEELAWDDNFIWRGLDTSPGGGRFYVQFEASRRMAKWCPRYMAVGETWEGPGHYVQFFLKGDCSKSAPNSGPATNVTTLFEYFPDFGVNGLKFKEVVHLGRQDGEQFWLAKGFGMIGWRSRWGEAFVSEVHTPENPRPNNVMESVCNFVL